ncbi:MAG: LptF/LptG family permease [Thermodesulfovibrio sp.]|nr:LptF/LptG family permease [Thermodesulfovibrio sp.]
MKLIHKAILKELTLNFLISLAFLNSVLIIEKLFKLSKIFASVGIDLFNLARLLLLLQPSILLFTTPMAMLLSILITYGRIQNDNEMMALMISGMPYKKTFSTVFYGGLVLFVLTAFLSLYLSPLGVKLLRERVLTILTERAPMGLEEGVFNQGFKGITIFVKEKLDNLHLKGIVIFDERDNTNIKTIISEEGRIQKEKQDINLSLIDGKIYFSRENSLYEISFGEYTFRITPNIENIAKKISEYSFFELLSKIKKENAKNLDFKLELCKRVSLPLLCIINLFLAPPLCYLIGRSGRIASVPVGLTAYIFYYVLMIYGGNLAKSGKIPPELGGLIPIFVVGILSFLLYKRLKS